MKTDNQNKNAEAAGLTAALGSAFSAIKGKAWQAVDAWVALYE